MKKVNLGKKIVTTLVTCAIIFALLPVSVFAESEEDEGIRISSKSITVPVGKSTNIRLEIYNRDMRTWENVSEFASWCSDNESVATVSATGRITACQEGAATISAYYNGYTKTCAVTVANIETEKEKRIKKESVGTIDSIFPENSVISRPPEGAGSLVPMVGENLSEKDDVNQEFLAKAFAASIGKTATIVTECTIYPTRALTQSENGSIQTLTFGNIPGTPGDNVYGLGYNVIDGAYVMKAKLDEEKTAKFEDFKLRSATNLSVFVCK